MEKTMILGQFGKLTQKEVFNMHWNFAAASCIISAHMSEFLTLNSTSLPSYTPPDFSTSSTTEKVKYLFTPGDWFLIGSALSTSSAVAVVLLRLVGKISFIQPFSACVISSIVLSLLWKICEDYTLDATPVVETVLSFKPKTWLGEGSSFDFQGQNYYIATTVGDGACGAHAVLGTKNSDDKYVYEGNVREYYVEMLIKKRQDPTFQLKWEDWMICFVQDYLSPNHDFDSKLVFSEPLVKDLKNHLSNLEPQKRQLQIEQEELFKKALKQEENQSIIMNVLEEEVKAEEKRTQKTGLQLKLQNDDKYKIEIMKGCLNPIILNLGELEIGQNIKDNLKAKTHIENERTKCFRACIKKEEVFSAYIQGVKNPAYYFSTQELGLMAHMFDRHVRVFGEINGIVTVRLDEGDRSHLPVEVFHSGIHFSRCERQNNL